MKTICTGKEVVCIYERKNLLPGIYTVGKDISLGSYRFTGCDCKITIHRRQSDCECFFTTADTCIFEQFLSAGKECYLGLHETDLMICVEGNGGKLIPDV